MRSVFSGTGAFLGRIEGETRIAFWADEPTLHEFDPSLLIAVDLSKCPASALMNSVAWDAIEVDDCYVGAQGELTGSTIGPRWPELNIFAAIFLEERFVASLPERLRPACPPHRLNGRPYEHKKVLYWPSTGDPRAGRRYAGHHAEILQEREGLVRVNVFPPGSSDVPGVRALPIWLDLSDPNQCDVGFESLTTIGIGDMPKSGALFLICGEVSGS